MMVGLKYEQEFLHERNEYSNRFQKVVTMEELFL